MEKIRLGMELDLGNLIRQAIQAVKTGN